MVGLSTLLCTLIVTFVFTAAGDGTTIPDGGPGASFPSAAELAASDGFVSGLSGAASILGVITLSFWAIAAATDFSTGLIRLLVQAEPRRLRLLAGKVLALTLCTAAVSLAATLTAIMTSGAMAAPAGIDTAAWANDGLVSAASDALMAWANTYLAMLIWGIIGLVIAVATRSSAIAIASGVGYVLVIESIVGLVAGDAAAWLPGAILTAIASGGTADVAYGAAATLGLAYALVGLAVSTVVFVRRDICD